MKHKNLEILREQGFRVPKFMVVKCADEYKESFSNAPFFAVRSSFSSEDRKDASFAGQYETFLNVPREEVKDKINLVLQSNQTERVQSYKEAKNIRSTEKAFVIVQDMVDADCAGVVFTANPVGILNEMVVVVGEGLGNNVVDDKGKTTTYYYHTDDDLYYYDRQEDAYLLEEEVLKELLRIAKEIQDLYGQYMDIEYAVKDHTIYILQARGITTFSLQHKIVLDNSNIVESYPGISLPLTQAFVQDVYYRIFQNCIRRITKNDAFVKKIDTELKEMTGVANWRIYYRISNWYAVLHILPFSKQIISTWQNMLGVTNMAVSLPEQFQVPSRIKFTVFQSFIYYLHHTPKLMDRLNHKFERQYPIYQNLIEAGTTIPELLGIYEQIKQEILKDWDITLVNDMYTFIYTALSGKKNKEFLADLKNLESMKPVRGIRVLSEIAQTQGMDSEQYKREAKRYIDKYGDRCLGELKLETKTYRTNKERLDGYVKQQKAEEENGERTYRNSRNIFVKKQNVAFKIENFLE